ncbi:heme oxygenase (biliverdin-producing) [Leucobacter luti]|uniref:biliverdin-producing heme oxygenase n=1 Tax=Leucobacter luti TaxID=340320 RepID=UPI001C68747E|nr:biliverdin-producing heme oxygenase [Leucobacter luti]QYM77026.1 biliverdin-producing heme oxygenase [Leucobacter luti]
MSAPQTTTEPLSAMLRRVSNRGHRGGDEGSAEPRYATAYLRGGLNREGIAAQAAQHFLMYEALEAATSTQLEQYGQDFAFAMPELRRLPALRADLAHWIGPEWETVTRTRYATPGITSYVERLTEVAASSLPHFVAHHYTRYLADLSGGLMIVKMFRDSYSIEGDDGVRFYVFDEIPDPRAFKDTYRALLDEFPFSEADRNSIAEEVQLAYDLNNAAGADLEARFEEYQA